MRCTEISAEWASQRIKGLSLRTAVLSAFNRGGARTIKTLIERFRYPRLGPGMMWEAARDRVIARGGEVRQGREVVSLEVENGRWLVRARSAHGTETVEAEHVISSAAMDSLATTLHPPLPEAAREAARSLRYRDFIMVALIMRDRGAIPDNWIYVHDPSVKIGRVQMFKSWSPEMVPHPSMTCLGAEYFCFEGDGLWTASDPELLEMAKRELEQLGLAKASDVTDGCVVRQKRAYPVYDSDYARHVATVRDALGPRYHGLHLVGRNGMHKYNNQDHSMMTAMLAADTIITGRPHDVWSVNTDAEYHEASTSTSNERLVPQKLTR
jgi:protoporphyrinogen oxidase